MKVLKPLKTATKLLESESEPIINRLAEIVFDEKERLKNLLEVMFLMSYRKILLKSC